MTPAREPSHTPFLMIETFKDDNMVPVYERLDMRGRGIVEGLRCIDSQVEQADEEGHSGCGRP